MPASAQLRQPSLSTPLPDDFSAPPSGQLAQTPEGLGRFAQPFRWRRSLIESTRPGSRSGVLTSPAAPASSSDSSGRQPATRPQPPLTQRQQAAARLRNAPAPVRPPPGINAPATTMAMPYRFVRRGSPNPETTSPQNVPTTVATLRRPLLPTDDPFAPTGIRAGSFLLRPAIEFIGGYDTNPTRIPGMAGSSLTTVAPELLVRSQWQRHALNADLRGTYTWYGQSYDNVLIDPTGAVTTLGTPENIDRPNVDSRVNGRLDVSSLSHADMEGRVLVSTDLPGSPNIQAGLKKFPLVTTVGGTFGYTQQFNRLEVTAKNTIDHITYQPSQMTDGSTISNADREYNQYGGSLRVGYELKPGLRPFVEGGADTRVHELQYDRYGYQRDSVGVYGKVGTTFEITRKLVGEMAIGYLDRSYQDPTLPDLQGLTIDGSLIYTATPLTTVTLTAISRADELIVAGQSGVLRRDLILQVDHALRRWLIGTVKAGYGLDDYIGSDRIDNRYWVSIGMLYRLNRDLQLRGEVRQDWLASNQPNTSWAATMFLVGIRFQR